jgi:hypothetical protein
MKDALAVADEERVEVKREKLAYALTQPRWVIQHFFAQKAKPPWRIPDYRISDDQQPPLRPVESHFARRFSGHAYHSQRADLVANLQLVVKFRSLASRVCSVARLDCSSSSSIRTHPVGRAHMVTVGEQNAPHASLRQLIKILLRWFHRIDDEITRPVANQEAVKVIAMRLRKPGPR